MTEHTYEAFVYPPLRRFWYRWEIRIMDVDEPEGRIPMTNDTVTGYRLTEKAAKKKACKVKRRWENDQQRRLDREAGKKRVDCGNH